MQIEFGGLSSAKGRNGYFALHHAVGTILPATYLLQKEIHIELFSKRSADSAPIYLQLVPEDLAALHQFLGVIINQREGDNNAVLDRGKH
jgi:hypothetical protein